MLDFELVVPAYNESGNLPLLLGQAVGAAQQAGFVPETFQFVLVDNGSTDDTDRVLGELSQTASAKWFRIVTVKKNQGYGWGLRSGLISTTARYVGWSHADLQCDPADAFRALQLVRSASPVKVLARGSRSGRDWKDRMVTRIFQLLSRVILGMKVQEINAQPKVFPRELLSHLTNPPHTFAFDLYVLYQAIKHGYPLKEVPVSFPPRVHGTSTWASHFLLRYKTIFGIIRYMFSLRCEEGVL